MNNENKPSVIAELTAALASMAERAAAAEAEAEQYKKSSGEWYQFFTSKDKELRDTQAELQKAREALEVTLHAIGTNDGGPDKAKGSAWTYCLKYYLFEKFGIDQGDDDPDMSDHSSEPPQQSQKQHTGTQNGNRQGNTQPQAQNGQTGRSGAARPLSDAQLSRLYRKGEDAGYSQQSINEWILKKYGQQDPHNLTRAQYDEACAAMDNAKQQGGQDNA